VRIGLGVGILAKLAVDPATDSALVVLHADHLLAGHATWIGFRRDALCRKSWCRGLLLLQHEGLITLRDGVGILPSVRDIVANPKGFKFRELDAAQLPRSLPDLDAAIINTNYALQAKLNPRRDAIAIESRTNNPYGNVIAVRARDQGRPVFKTLVAAYQSDEIRQFILTQFDGAILPVF